MSKYFFSFLLFCCPCFLFAQANEAEKDTVVVKKVMNSGHQLRLSFDVGKFLMNSLANDKSSYEVALDYYWKNELYGVLETGAGNSSINYPDLQYKSTNLFFRAGMDKAMFVRKKPQDWGMAFVGFRYGFGLIKRSEAQYTTNDGLGGITSGSVPSLNFTAHWFELTGGMRVELFKNTFAGWNVRFKFLLNQGAFGSLKPAYIAGYGGGEKGTAFDYNFYIAYALRWASRNSGK